MTCDGYYYVKPERPWYHTPPFIYDEGVVFERYLIDNQMKVLVSKISGGYHRAELLGNYYCGSGKFIGTAHLPQIAISDLRLKMSLSDYTQIKSGWFFDKVIQKKFPHFK